MNSIQSRFSYSARAMVDTGRAPRDEATSIQGKSEVQRANQAET